jgi:hypothetical protein
VGVGVGAGVGVGVMENRVGGKNDGRLTWPGKPP